jgi:hypothetical protein
MFLSTSELINRKRGDSHRTGELGTTTGELGKPSALTQEREARRRMLERDDAKRNACWSSPSGPAGRMRAALQQINKGRRHEGSGTVSFLLNLVWIRILKNPA